VVGTVRTLFGAVELKMVVCALPALDAALVAFDVEAPVTALDVPPVACEWLSAAPPWLSETATDPDCEALSLVEVDGPTVTPPLLALEPPLVSDCWALEVEPDWLLEAAWSPWTGPLVCCAIAASGEKVRAATQAAVIR
jgi:hypothetical protein